MERELRMNLQEIIERKLEKSEKLDKFLEQKAEELFQRRCVPVLCMEQCIEHGRKMQAQNLNVSRIIINVEENEQATGEHDALEIVIAALDSRNKPIQRKGEEVLAVSLYAGTLDKKLIDFLDGADKKIYQL